MGILASAATGLGAALVSGAAGLMQRSSSGVSWGDLKKQDLFAARADERALTNSKRLFDYETSNGPRLSVRAYEKAGINPILVGDFNPSPVTMSSHAASSSPVEEDSGGRSGRALISALDTLLKVRQLQSSLELTDARAADVRQRTALDQSLADMKRSLMEQKLLAAREVPAKIRAEVGRLVSDSFLNSLRAGNIESQTNLNAKQLENLISMIHYRDELLKILGRKDFIGLGRFGGIHFNFTNLLKGAWSNAKQFFSEGHGAPQFSHEAE